MTPDRRTPSTHWAQQSERGSLWLMRLGFGAARRLGRRALAPVVWLVVLYFYASRASSRRAIADYQRRLRQCGKAAALPRYAAVYRQYLVFAQALLDKLDVWRNNIRRADLDLVDAHHLHAQMGAGRGQILITSHLGNVDVTRALAREVAGLTLNVLVHHQHAQRFAQLLSEAGGDVHLIEVSALDAGLMLDLAQRLERGQWLAIAGDRVPVKGERTTPVQFLGGTAMLPQGPWLLAALLGSPVNLLLCLRKPKRAAQRFTVVLERLSDAPSLARAERAPWIAANAQRYADRLAHYCQGTPLQWFNFYPFWTIEHANTRTHSR